MKALLLRTGRWLARRPLPAPLLNLLLMLRWRCLIHPLARVEHPRNLVLARGVRIGRCTLLCRGRAGNAVTLGERVVLHDGVIVDALDGWIEIGADTTINPYCVLYGTGGLHIGAHCGVATHTVIVAANHSFERADLPIVSQPLRAQGIEIADDVWIGAGCRILDGARLGRGCVAGAGAVVSRRFDEGSVVAGVPARTMKMREGFAG